jgi:hypothetical protein
MNDEIDVIKEEIKEEIKDQIKKVRPPYLVPSTKFSKADQVIKTITVGYGLGFQIPRDVCFGMKLRKGQLLRVTLELFPEDTDRLNEEYIVNEKKIGQPRIT